MERISELRKILGEYVKCNKARLDCFARMMLGVIAVRTVNLEEIALAFESDAKKSSRYRRLQRFFAEFKIDLRVISAWIFRLFFKKDEKVYLIIDRTNWYWGRKTINVLMLAVAYEGLAIPVMWKMLKHGGNSTGIQQKALLNRFIKLFGKSCIGGVLADREFGNEEWIGWMVKKKIPFYIRIKKNIQVRVLKSKYWDVDRLFNQLNLKQQSVYENYVEVFGQKDLRIAGSRSERGELMIVLTNQSPHNAIAIYQRRWEIENLFQSLKSRGFCFESTHMTEEKRIEKLLAVLAISFCWAHKIGEWQAEQKPIALKKFQNQWRPQHSYFRYGLDVLRDSIFHIHRGLQKLLRFFTKLLLPDLGEVS